VSAMKDDVYELVTQRDWVSFAELSKHVHNFRGHWSFEPLPNISFWPTMSKEAVAAVNDLLQEKRIILAPTVPLTYWIDGHVPNLPVAKLPNSKRGYKKLHWLPVCLRPWSTHKKRSNKK
jgi:hypothetical protein